jgi:type IV secretion system protein VirD4
LKNHDYGTKRKSQVGNYIVSFIVVVSLFLLVNILATQYVAQHFGYHENLGNALYQNFYNPFGWIIWQQDFYTSYSYFFKTLNIMMFFIIAAVFIVFILIRLLALRKSKTHDDVHGTAHWMRFDELKETNLLDQKEGVYIGGYEEGSNLKYLKHNGPEHVLAFAPTRSGKGIGLVLPTLLDWRESVIVLDIKGENWALTAGWREEYANNRVLKFDPTADNGLSVKFNPLEEIRIGGSYEIGDLQNIAMMIVDTEGKGLRDYWEKSSFSFISGLILHTIHKAQKEKKPYPNLTDVYKLLNGEEIRDLLEEMLKSEHHLVSLVGREMLNKASEELSGVVGSSSSYLNLYVDPIISNNTSKSEFKISDLMNDEKPVSLYLVLKPNDKNRIMPLIRLIMNQLLRRLLEELEFENGKSVKTYRHRMLLMLDEFTSLGRLGIFQESLAFMGGYGIKAYIIIQDITQLYEAYGKDESILSNCHIRIAYAPNKVETAELLSKMSGTTTVVKSYTTTSGSRISVMLGQVTESLQEISRPLLTPDECMRLRGAKKENNGEVIEGGDMLIFIAGQAPIYGKQILFFKDQVFLDRSKVAAPKFSSSALMDEFEDEVKLV